MKAAIVLTTAVVIFWSFAPVWRFRRAVDLNSSTADSPDSISDRNARGSMSCSTGKREPESDRPCFRRSLVPAFVPSALALDLVLETLAAVVLGHPD